MMKKYCKIKEKEEKKEKMEERKWKNKKIKLFLIGIILR